jgi:hypothetical protein
MIPAGDCCCLRKIFFMFASEKKIRCFCRHYTGAPDFLNLKRSTIPEVFILQTPFDYFSAQPFIRFRIVHRLLPIVSIKANSPFFEK